MIDLLLIGVLGAVTWSVASEGAWGAAQTLLCSLFAGLLAMNWFEPTAAALERTFSGSYTWSYRWDVIALVGLFGILVTLLRMATDYLSPRFIHVHALVHELARWGCGLLTGYVCVGFLMTALHTAPLPREFLGFTPEPERRSGVLAGLAPDFQWLGFVQYVSEYSLARGSRAPRIFDGPRFRVANQPNEVWPSFPIRYASRREEYAMAAPAPRIDDTRKTRRKRRTRSPRTDQPDF